MADKILIDQNGASSFEERPVSTVMDDPAHESLAYVPVSKVDDADQYVVIDIPGGTENLSGSGNLNFQLLQSQIMDGNAQLDDTPEFQRSASADINAPAAIAAAQPGIAAPDAGGAPFYNGFHMGGETAASGGAAGVNNSADERSASAAPGTIPSSPVFASQSATNFQSEGGGGQSGVNGINGADGANGNNGTNGSNGADGSGGGGGGDTTIIYNNSPVINNYTNVVNNGTYETITNNTIINNVSDNDTTIINNDNTLIDLGDVTGAVTTISTTVVNNVTDLTTAITNNLFTTIDNVTNNTFETVNTLIETITHILPPLSGGDGGSLLPVDIGGIIGIGQDQPDHDIAITGDLNDLLSGLTGGQTTVILNGVEDIIGDVDLGLGLHSGLFGDNNPGGVDQPGDVSIGTDIGLLDNTLLQGGLSFNIDAVEQIIGDVDLNLNLATDLLGAIAAPLLDNAAGGGSILAPVGDVLSDIAGGLLSPGADNGDTDIAIGLGGNLGPVEDLSQSLAVTLNPVEDVVGDIDLGLQGNLNLLHGADTSAGEAAADVSINTDIQIAGYQVDLPSIDLNLDLLENIVGDIDLNLGLGTNLLGDVAGGLFDNAAGGSGSALAPIGDILSDVGSTLLGDPSDASTPVNQLLDIVNSVTGPEDTVLSTVTGAIFDITANPLDAVNVVQGALTDGLPTALGTLTDALTDGDAGANNLLSTVDDLLGQVHDSLGGLTSIIDAGISTLTAAPDSNAITSIITQTQDDVLSSPWVESVVQGAITDPVAAVGGAVEHILSDPVGSVLGGLGDILGGGDSNGHGLLHGRGLFG